MEMKKVEFDSKNHIHRLRLRKELKIIEDNVRLNNLPAPLRFKIMKRNVESGAIQDAKKGYLKNCFAYKVEKIV